MYESVCNQDNKHPLTGGPVRAVYFLSQWLRLSDVLARRLPVSWDLSWVHPPPQWLLLLLRIWGGKNSRQPLRTHKHRTLSIHVMFSKLQQWINTFVNFSVLLNLFLFLSRGQKSTKKYLGVMTINRPSCTPERERKSGHLEQKLFIKLNLYLFCMLHPV